MGDGDAGPFTDLVTDLERAGFTLMGHTVDEERFGNSLLLLRRGATRLRVVKDRSRWFLEIAGPGTDDWFGPAVWLAMLDGQLPPAGLIPAEEQAELVLHRLAEIEQASADESGQVVEQLRSWQARRAAARRTQSPNS